MRLDRGWLVPAWVVILAVAGCATARPATDPAASLASGGSATLTSQALDMVTESGDWPATEDQLDAANDEVVTRCMTAHGLPFTGGLNRAVDNGNEPLIVGMAGRRAHGYGLDQAGSDASRPATAQDAYVAGLPAAARQHYLQVLFGSDADRITVDIPGGGQATYPTEGCQASAIRALAGDINLWGLITYVPQELGNRLADELGSASGYQAALASWRGCMAGRGMPYPDPDHALRALRAEYQTSGATSAVRGNEIATAVADGECALRVHLPLAALTARRALAAQLPVADRRRLVELAAARTTAVARAVAILQHH
ncbi:MAG: hypothetical protein ACJ74U_01020 [Jatrophihabitantaceae bacterium]